MGKRKRTRSGESEYQNICRKVKKLERKLEKYKRSSSSSSTDRSRQQHEGSPYHSYYGADTDHECGYNSDERTPQEQMTLQNKDEIVDMAMTFQKETTSSVPLEKPEKVLDPEILNILGEDPTMLKEYDDELHKDIAARWSHILCNGLTKDSKSDIMKEYLPAKNCGNMKPPKLNLEIEAALSPINVKKDLFSQSKQKQLSNCLAAVGTALNWALSSKDAFPQAQNIIKPLSDAGRLLSDCHYRESQSRRYAIINNLNKQTRDAVKNTKIDELLFGSSLAEHLKSSKAISRSGFQMKSTIQRPSFKPPPSTTQNQRGALNVRGMPRGAFEPRQNPAPRRQLLARRELHHDASRRNNSARRGARKQ